MLWVLLQLVLRFGIEWRLMGKQILHGFNQGGKIAALMIGLCFSKN